MPSSRFQERLATVPVEVWTRLTVGPRVTLRLLALEPVAVKLATGAVVVGETTALASLEYAPVRVLS